MKAERQIYRFEVKRGARDNMDSYSVITSHVMCDDEGNPIVKGNGEYQYEEFSKPMTLTEARLDLPGILGIVFNQILRRNDELEALLLTVPEAKLLPVMIEVPAVIAPPPLPAKVSWITKIKAWFTQKHYAV